MQPKQNYPKWLLTYLLGLVWLHLTCLDSVRDAIAVSANCTTGDCQHGGVCNNFTASPPCICPLPYIAPYCSAAVNYCNTLQPEKNITSLPVCLNGGNCTMGYTDPYFNFTCPYLYGGTRCNDTITTTSTTTTTTTTTTNTTTAAAATTTAKSASCHTFGSRTVLYAACTAAAVLLVLHTGDGLFDSV